MFIAHSYQYSPELSTFLIEVDPDTWQRAGLDKASDEESRRICAEVFRPELGSNDLLSNRSLWFEANIVSNAHWSHGNVVLLGDALRDAPLQLQGAEGLGSTPEEYGAYIRSEIKRWAGVVKSTGVSLD